MNYLTMLFAGTSSNVLWISVFIVLTLLIILYFFVKGKKPSDQQEIPKGTSSVKDELTSASKAVKTMERGGIGTQANDTEKDNLKLIKGVGPVLEKKLNDLGIFSFKQISQLSETDIEMLSSKLGSFAGRITRDNWKEQAKGLMN